MAKELWLFGTFKDKLTRSGTRSIIEAMTPELAKHQGTSLHIGVCPTFVALDEVLRVAPETGIAVGAQDCTWADSVSFTGGTSCASLVELGVSHVILGHSERRLYLGETDEMVYRKASAAIAAGLVPIVCIGEFYDDVLAERVEPAIRAQVEALAPALRESSPEAVILAYEPAWAISTSKQGLKCEPDVARQRHALVREIVADAVSPEHAAAIRLLYGGSVDGSNGADYFTQVGVDGGLVGSASQTPEKFTALIAAAATSTT